MAVERSLQFLTGDGMTIARRSVLYGEWIDKNVSEPCHGMCKKYAQDMADKFPELRAVRGEIEVESLLGSLHTVYHWWCEDEYGNVVDPTVKQFIRVLKYEELTDGRD
jgi:hypothetical protein